MLDVAPDDPRLVRVRLAGTALDRAGARIRRGEFMADRGSPEEREVAIAVFRDLRRTRRINWRRGPSALGYMEHVPELERVILPLATDGIAVDGFLNLSVFYFADGSEL